ncbi:response regulator transcription factor [Allofustis seminis]|uniref:response regulator transcription factor n=1 Tax=Allofustis seminis TaxID=166939 RepID=UPI0003704F2B|nr:response regulator transcription factor [Allofustis seminis]
MIGKNICMLTHSPHALSWQRQLLTAYGAQVTIHTFDAPLIPADFIVCDLILVHHDDFSVIFEIRNTIRLATTASIIYMATTDRDIPIPSVLDGGFDDYFPITVTNDEFIARINSHLRCRARYIHPGTVRTYFRHIEIDHVNYCVTIKGKTLHFTKREFQILLLLARSPGTIFTAQQICDHINAGHMHTSPHSSVQFIHQIRKKFSTFNLTPIQTHHGLGYSWYYG